ncbi:MAG: cytochrome c biogenesis protein CcsA [Acidimicrobiia bacterium]|nr:cytochrome c biogenesis protein CcsA [Acidimicrobiia bacterium]
MNVGAGLLLLGVVLAVSATIRPSRLLIGATAGAMTGATVALVSALAREDWANTYVVSTARPGLPWPVRLAGLWGGAEGSLLFFTALLSIAAALVAAWDGRTQPVTALTAAYGIVVVVSANPFARFDAPAVGGLGLQPVLEHPAMVWHPPILYIGLIGVIVPTLLAFGSAPPELVRRASAVGLAFLTAGLATGAAWAHAELGWGGFWAWDPIESAGLVAWLITAASIHLRFDRSRLDHRILFALPGLAAVWATTLTRAGLTGSVHAFADRPGLDVGLLIVATGWSGTSAWLIFTPSIERGGPDAGGRTELRLAMYTLAIAAFFVALGTYEPAVEQALGGDAVGVNGVFFTRMLWPLVIIGAALSIRADRHTRFAIVGAAVAVVVTPLGAGPFGLAVAAGGGGVVGAALAARSGGRKGWLAHVGAGVILVGIAGTVAATSSQVILVKDRPTDVNSVTFTHRGLELVEEQNRDRAIATVDVEQDRLQPELVAHRLRNVPTAEAATHRTLFNEIQVILSDGTDGQATYQINQTPRLNLIWFGSLLMVLGLAGTRARRREPMNPVALVE